MAAADSLARLHELQVHRLELATQNEELLASSNQNVRSRLNSCV